MGAGARSAIASAASSSAIAQGGFSTTSPLARVGSTLIVKLGDYTFSGFAATVDLEKQGAGFAITLCAFVTDMTPGSGSSARGQPSAPSGDNNWGVASNEGFTLFLVRGFSGTIDQDLDPLDRSSPRGAWCSTPGTSCRTGGWIPMAASCSAAGGIWRLRTD